MQICNANAVWITPCWTLSTIQDEKGEMSGHDVFELLKAVAPVLAALIGGGIAVFFAVRIYRLQRWWEHKEHAYREIIEALHDLIRYSELCAEESEEYLSRAHEHPKNGASKSPLTR